MAKKGGSVKSIATTNNNQSQSNQQNNSGILSRLQKIAKIDRLPKDVRETIPFRGVTQNGIIETYPGTFTKTYKLTDMNFTIAPEEEQMEIYQKFMNILNSFNSSVKWSFTIFNHEIDKKKTIQEIRVLPRKDGLNKYRQEINANLLAKLKEGNNSIKHEKMLTVAIEAKDVRQASEQFKNLDNLISQKIRALSGFDAPAMTTQERVKLLYSIYNQDYDYRFATSIYDNKEVFNMDYLIKKHGLQVKDLVGPSSFDFRPGRVDMFMIGDTYAQCLYLHKVPSMLNTTLLSDLSAIQSNMLITSYFETEDIAEATKLANNKLASIDAQAAGLSKRNSQDGYFGALPPNLEKAQASARELINDLTSRDQNAFFVTFVIVVFSRTLNGLIENVKLVQDTADKHLVELKSLKFQQEFALSTALPLCRNDIMQDRFYTSESAGVFIPYDTQELMQKNSIFYGLNKQSKNMILYDRTTGDNYNGLIFGMSGSGKSMTAKWEMISVLLSKSDVQIFVIDPQGEYSPIASALGGQHIRLAPGANNYINPLDLDISTSKDDEDNPIVTKVDFVVSLFDIILGKNASLRAEHTNIIDKSVRNIYRAYIDQLSKEGKTYDADKCPTLSDLYQELIIQKAENPAAGALANLLYSYAQGSFDIFAHRTNVETTKRLVIYDTSKLGTGLKELGLHVCTSDIQNRMISNSKKKIYTWFYIDEFHILLESESTTAYLRRIWKMARKWLGVPTGIMQNTEDLLRNEDSRAIFNNTSFIIILKEPMMDRQNLQQLLNLSISQLEHITDSEKGTGLLYNGKIVVPFENRIDRNTELYSIMTTAHDAAV